MKSKFYLLLCTVLTGIVLAPVSVYAQSATGNDAAANASDILGMPGYSYFQNPEAQQQTSSDAQTENAANNSIFKNEQAGIIVVDPSTSGPAVLPVTAKPSGNDNTLTYALIAVTLACIALLVFVINGMPEKSGKTMSLDSSKDIKEEALTEKEIKNTKPKKKKNKKHHR